MSEEKSEAKTETPTSENKGLSPIWAGIIVATITTLGTVIVALVNLVPALIPPTPTAVVSVPVTDTPTITLTVDPASSGGGATAASATSSPTGTSAAVAATENRAATSVATTSSAAGSFDVTLIYGSRDSFTILVNAGSDLSALVLETPLMSETVVDSFSSSLSAMNNTADPGVCLRYIREGTFPALPRACTRETTFEHTLLDADVFWFDRSHNQFQDVALKQSGTVIGLCPSTGGSGRCDFQDG